MTDIEFLDLAERLLQTVEESCDRIDEDTDADIDAQRSGGMVTLTFPNRTQIVLNQQKPLHELWLATKSGGYHFKYQDGAWQDTKGAGELLVLLSREASAQAGMPLRFGA
ncbi:iron donor protein CyaY [uncultured Xylophilus sp.]|uniref:iron donor protein CyaY n=1 Tax=uncultured Xylophilus sp. TaxID=296832 RepID=UPI0025F10E51|nr:iron donor protein CyaY [uncultured Xylophilus sp.]